MKHLKLLLGLSFLSFCYGTVSAQFLQTPNAGGRYMDNHPQVHSVGIGDFGGAILPEAVLHVNSNITKLKTTLSRGEVFRTSGPTNLDNSWRMFTGAGNGTERFSITTPANSDDAVLSTIQNGAMMFNTNNTQRMHINQNTGFTNGFIGMGNGFNNPQSHLHINNPLNEETWLQITNVDVGETTTDGLRLGILDETPGQPSYGYLRWQENTPFIIQTQRTGSAGVINSERIRITTNQGNPDPFNPEGDNTRIGISNRGEEHITLIRSLLHLGYNTGFLINNINATDGWRSWMDVGTFTNNGRENMYVGLKQEAPEIIGLVPQPGARFDAVINWGDNEPVPSDGRYNNLRFIYTTPVTTTNNQPHTAWNGLETMRIEPTVASTLTAPNFGMVGIGDFSPEGPNTNGVDVVNAKLDIDGDLRVRTVTEDNALTQVLVIDPTDHNRVHWRAVSSIGGGGTGGTVTADNGLRIFPVGSSNVQLGQANTGGTALTGGELLNDREIPLNDNSLLFSRNGRIGIGNLSSSKLTIRNDATPWEWDNILLLRNSLGGTTLSVTKSGRTTINSADAEALGVNFNAVSGSCCKYKNLYNNRT